MTKTTCLRVGIVVAALFIFISTTTPGSAAPVTFVASSGSDANPCTRAQPCATFFGAGGVTDPGGEVDCLDSGPYGGNVLFSKSITIDCPGGVYRPNFTAFSEGSGILRVRNLKIVGNGAASGSSGIIAGTGSSVFVENCVIEQFTGPAISMQQGAEVVISDTLIVNNGGTGVSVNTSGSGASSLVLTRVRVQNNGNGVLVRAGAADLHASIEDSTITSNQVNGVYSISTGAGRSLVLLKRSVVAHNGSVGVLSENANAFVFVSTTTITGNDVGWQSSAAGNVFTYDDNNVNLNRTSNGTPTGTANVQ